jgi:hypothetical protein
MLLVFAMNIWFCFRFNVKIQDQILIFCWFWFLALLNSSMVLFYSLPKLPFRNLVSKKLVPNINDANNKMFFMIVNSKLLVKFCCFEMAANFVTYYFPLTIKFLRNVVIPQFQLCQNPVNWRYLFFFIYFVVGCRILHFIHWYV